MCPKFKNGICEVAGIEPEYVECAVVSCCYTSSNGYEVCKLYMVESLLNYYEKLLNVAA